MIISAKIVWKPRKLRLCDGCGKLIHGSAIRLYGAADNGDKPYAVYCHPTQQCTGGGDKVINLLAIYETETREVERTIEFLVSQGEKMNSFDEKVQILSQEVTCRHCAGTGQHYSLQCGFCSGTGKMMVARFEKTDGTQRGAYEIEFSDVKECVWRETDEAWSTSCGDLFTINDGTPADNGMFFCHHCGKKLVVAIEQEMKE